MKVIYEQFNDGQRYGTKSKIGGSGYDRTKRNWFRVVLFVECQDKDEGGAIKLFYETGIMV